MPGGVNSPVRAYNAVGCEPVFAQSGEGSRVTDIDGNTYIDYVGSYGPLILGHAFEPVTRALHDAVARGTTFGMPTEAETDLAEMVIDEDSSPGLRRLALDLVKASCGVHEPVAPPAKVTPLPQPRKVSGSKSRRRPKEVDFNHHQGRKR